MIEAAEKQDYSTKAREIYDALWSTHPISDWLKVLEQALTTIGNEREAIGYANGIEAAARLVEPQGSPPCDCVEWYETDLGKRCRPICDCGNVGDTAQIVSWCEGKNDAARLRALPLPPKGK